MKNVLFLLTLFLGYSAACQDSYLKNPDADVLSYVFRLSLNDESDVIDGRTTTTVAFKKPTRFTLDLIKKSEVYGMEVVGVYSDDRPIEYRFEKDQITVAVETPGEQSFTIAYRGIPEVGLIIDTTKYGQRSIFGDNWPNLARHWLPCVDHPYDKASVTFEITAPEYYDVVATGKKLEESNLGDGLKLTTYHEPAPIAMKVVTIGVTRFATKLLEIVDGVEVSAWVYPENREDGFSDYAVATNVLMYFTQNIGPYPYAKLANMQAKTQWGGLENAGTIAYAEKSVTGKNEVVGLIAHEIAHQWFGNSATESSWNHVWLSEGFATYFSTLYLESVHGNEKRKEEQLLDREQVIEYYNTNPSPIVDLSITDPMKVLNKNTYQKGGWVLNMLRKKLGQEVFWEGIRTYYETYKNSNVMTADFRRAMESVYGEILDDFFQQWVFTKGYPELEWSWEYSKDKIVLSVEQKQKHHVFAFPLEIGFLNNGEMRIETVQVASKTASFELPMDLKPDEVILDPDVWLLFEEK